MKGKYRKPTQSVFRSRDPGPRELQKRWMENVFAKAEVKQTPQRQETPQEPKRPTARRD